MNLTFKTHLFHEDPLSKSVIQNILLPSISCLVIQGELNRRMSLLLHVQVHNDQMMTMIILLFCKTSVVSSFLQDNCIFQFSFYLQEWVYPVALSLSENDVYFSFHFHFLCRKEFTQLHFHFPRMIYVLVFTFRFLQERVYPVALSLSKNDIYFSFHFHFSAGASVPSCTSTSENDIYLVFTFSFL